MVGVDIDFPRYDRTAFRECLNLRIHSAAVTVEELESFGLVARTLSHQLGEPCEIGDGHTGFAQFHADLQPLHVDGGVLASPAGGPPDRTDEQSLALVEAQRMHAQARPLRDLTNAQRLGIRVDRHGIDSSSLI